MSRHNRSIGWQAVHYAAREHKPIRVQLVSSEAYLIGPVLAIGSEPDYFVMGCDHMKAYIDWEAVQSAIVIGDQAAA